MGRKTQIVVPIKVPLKFWEDFILLGSFRTPLLAISFAKADALSGYRKKICTEAHEAHEEEEKLDRNASGPECEVPFAIDTGYGSSLPSPVTRNVPEYGSYLLFEATIICTTVIMP